MTSCSLYYPGLLGPKVPLEELASREWPGYEQLPHLCKLFSHGQRHSLPASSLEARILQGMGITLPFEQDVPLAYFRARHLPHPIEQATLWCLDPVYLQIDQEEAVVLANEQLELSESEARHIIDDLNAHFAADELVIHYLNPHQWLLQGALSLTTHTLSEVMQQSVGDYQPQGKDENRWRKFLNEAQMLLHAHPVNQAREQRSEATANSLWLWGGAQLDAPPHYEPIIDKVYSDQDFVHEVARVCDIRHDTLPVLIDDHLLDYHTSLIIYTEQLGAIKTRDVFSWFDYLKRFDGQVLLPLFNFLKDGKLQSLTLYSDTLSLTLTRKALGKWWKRRKLFETGILDLRQRHGY